MGRCAPLGYMPAEMVRRAGEKEGDLLMHTILIVDDQLDFAQPMAFWFKSKGFSVTVASNLGEVLKGLQESVPDLIFLDIIMPGVDGPAMLKKIREVSATVSVIMMSSYIEDKRDDKRVNYYQVSGIFFKGDDFSQALAMAEPLLKKSSSPS
jgi:CheY-like chemotaxis protein